MHCYDLQIFNLYIENFPNFPNFNKFLIFTSRLGACKPLAWPSAYREGTMKMRLIVKEHLKCKL